MLTGQKRAKTWVSGLIGLFVVLMGGTGWAAVDISDVPLDAQTKAAPANIMFVLDDSGSMDWEMMTPESDGVFSGRYYVFDSGDNLPYSNSILTYAERHMWKSQWFGYNTMYYNPALTYEPWPTMPDADPDTPRAHPNVAGTTFDLSASYLQVFATTFGMADIIVDNKDAGFSKVSGSWYESGATPEWADSSLYSNSTGAKAQWTFTIPTADTYQVLAWWSSSAGWLRDTTAQYTVAHNSGTTTYTVNQMADFGQWNVLGVHDFAAGSSTIELLRGDSNSSADAVRLVQGTASPLVEIPNAHYYVYSEMESRPYLVTVNGGAINYYAVTSLSGTGGTESVATLVLNSTPPSDVVTSRTYVEERQNFANWYSFYRRRELTATASVSRVIAQMSGVQIGISTINGNIVQPVLRVKVGSVDETPTLLSTLYGLVLQAQGTPLRIGLRSVGRYYHQDDGYTGGIGTCPYWAAADGGECQQAFAILMTDGYWNGSSPSVGNVDGSAGPPYADTFYDTLADVAFYYWANDLSNSATTGLSNLVPTTSVDTADWQHMVTYGVSFGVAGTLNPNDYDLTTSPPPTIPWPSPHIGDERHKIDDLFHASVNGRGKFLSAGNPEELIDSLLEIMLDIEARIGSASSVSVNGDQIYKRIDENTFMFQSSYDTVGWVGDIRAFKVDPNTGAIDLFNPEWTASSVWAAEDWSTYWTNRVIATYDGGNGVPFRIASLTSAQQALLGANAADVLEYVRGRDNNEEQNGGVFRNRTSRLGDIVHSSPIYNDGILYAGANDGMLHAILAEGANVGKELFSYVPSQVIQNLPALTDPGYLHNYYVDLTPTVQKLTINSAEKTLLVGGLGQGGLGYFGLDLTGLTTFNTGTQLWDPAAVDENGIAGRVLWEFPNATTSAADVSDIGYSFSESLIVKTNDSSHPWVVIFGNGYNSADGKSVLFILDPISGSVLRKFELGAGPDNGLATPAVTDVNSDGKADYVYAGDLQGNLWKINLTDGDINNWAVAFNDGSTDVPLFQAVGSSGVQPITAKPDVMRHPSLPGYMVVFGTGKFLGLSDSVDSRQQTVYGIWDYGDDTDSLENLGTFDPATGQVSSLSVFSTLLEQTVLVDDLFYDPDSDGTGEIVRVTSDNVISWGTVPDVTPSENPNPSASAANHVGWFFNLPKAGERVVSRMMIRDSKAIFISYIPMLTPCSTGGDSILHELMAADGSRPGSPVFDVTLDGVIDSSDHVLIEDPSSPGNYIYVVPSGVQREGQLQSPAILQIEDDEIKYMSSTSGSIETVRERGVRTGITSWQQF